MALKYDVVRADFEYLEKVCENGGDFVDIHAEMTSVLMKRPTKKTATHFYHRMILEWFSCIETKKMNDIVVPRSVLSDSRVINIAERYMVDLSEQEAAQPCTYPDCRCPLELPHKDSPCAIGRRKDS